MPASKKRNKKYNPNKTIHKFPVMFRYSNEALRNSQIQIYQHLINYEQGDGQIGDWVILEFRIKCGLGLIDFFNDSDELKRKFTQALDSLSKLKTQWEENGSWLVTQEELKLYRECFELTDQMQDNSTRAEQSHIFKKAFDHADRLFTHYSIQN